MEAETNKILDDFFAGNNKRLIIPVYQRNYDWRVQNVRTLMNDLETVIKTGNHHFFGVIVYKLRGHTVKSWDAQIIDGQQRLTTITLLLQALKDLCDDKHLKGQIDKYLISKSRKDGEDYNSRLKLKPIRSDQPQYKALLGGRLNELPPDSNFLKNYEEAKRYIQRWLKNGISVKDVLQAINKLQVVGISVQDKDDDPQIIFESINSTGVRLTNSDLIRNFLLIDAKDPQRLFDQYWIKIENMLHPEQQSDYLDEFFGQFMIMNFSAKVTKFRIYQYFVRYYHDNFSDKEEALKTILDYANIYSRLVFPDREEDVRIKTDLSILLKINQTTCYPFFLQVFHDCEIGLINADELAQIVNLVTMFIIRRTICGYPVNAFRSIFASLYSQVFKVRKNKNKYYAAINKYLFTRLNLPTDDQLKDALLHNNLYANKAFCRFLLLNIENWNSNEQIKDNRLTIEHIMPQHLSKGWSIPEEDHETYLNRLGNLSLTGNNSKMSNKPFLEKRSILLKYTKIKILNEDLLDKKDWTIDDIKQRGKHLAKIIMDQYAVKEVKDPSIIFENVDTLTLDDLNSGKGRKPVAIVLDGIRYSANSFRKTAAVLGKVLDQNNPNLLELLVESKDTINGHLIYAHYNAHVNMKNNFALIRDGIYVQNEGSSRDIMRVLRKLLKYYKVDQNKFKLLVRAKNN